MLSAAPPSAPNAKPSKASNAIFIGSSCPQTALWCVSDGAIRFKAIGGKLQRVIPGRIEDANYGAQLRT